MMFILIFVKKTMLLYFWKNEEVNGNKLYISNNKLQKI